MSTKTLILPLCIAAASLAGCKNEPCDKSGVICTFAGVPQKAQVSPDGRLATNSELYLPQDIVFDEDGTAYLPDFNNHRLRVIDPEGYMETVSGTGFLGDGPEGDSSVFAWNHPTGIAIDPKQKDILHVSAWHNSRINRIDLSSGDTVFECGTGGRDYAGDGGTAMEAVLDLPSSVAFDSKGNLYVTDQANQAIRRVLPDDTIELVAGDPGEDLAGKLNAEQIAAGETPTHQDAIAGYDGDGGPAADALLYAEIGQAADPSSKLTIVDDVLYFADSGNNTIRKIDLDTMIIDRVAGVPWNRPNGKAGLPVADDPTAGDGKKALDAYLNNPRDVAVGIDGEIYIADTDNHCVRVVRDGKIDTFAGKCGALPMPGDKFKGEEEPATEARLFAPYGVEVDFEGNVYIADTKNHVIRRVAY